MSDITDKELYELVMGNLCELAVEYDLDEQDILKCICSMAIAMMDVSEVESVSTYGKTLSIVECAE